MTVDQDEIVRQLAILPLFSELSEAHRASIATQARLLPLARGDVLFRQGDPMAGFYYVVSGLVKLAMSSPQGSEKVIEIIGARQSFGEAVMFLDRPAPVFAQALEATEVVLVRREVVFEMLAAEPEFARQMLAGMSMRLHGLVRDVEAYALHNATERVASFLVQSLESDESGGAVTTAADTLELSASKQVIASRLNLTPETLSRIFHTLSDSKLIRVDGKFIHVLDANGLRRLGTGGMPAPGGSLPCKPRR